MTKGQEDWTADEIKVAAKAIHALHESWFGTAAWHVLDPQERAAFRDEAAAALGTTAALRARVEELEGALILLRGVVREGGVPRYTVTPGAALNSIIEEVVDPALSSRRRT